MGKLRGAELVGFAKPVLVCSAGAFDCVSQQWEDTVYQPTSFACLLQREAIEESAALVCSPTTGLQKTDVMLFVVVPASKDAPGGAVGISDMLVEFCFK
jgi:hypothetical protein